MQLHTRKVNTPMYKWIFMRVIKPNPSSFSWGNSLENLLNLVSIRFFSSNSAILEGFTEQFPLNAIE